MYAAPRLAVGVRASRVSRVFFTLKNLEMKLFFIIIYTVISTYPTPCPDDKKADGSGVYISCAVFHGMTTETIKVEEMTTDTAKVNTLLRAHPDAKVDTFLLTPFIRG